MKYDRFQVVGVDSRLAAGGVPASQGSNRSPVDPDFPVQIRHGDRPVRSKMTPAENREMPWYKPYGGMWTSSLTTNRPHATDWLRWCCAESWGTRYELWQIVGEPGSRVAVVDSMDDLEKLLKGYGLLRDERFDSHFAAIDFEAMRADGFAGLRLTEDGMWTTHLPPRGPSMYGWDAESTVWFDPMFVATRKIGEWHLNQCPDGERRYWDETCGDASCVEAHRCCTLTMSSIGRKVEQELIDATD